MVNVEEEALKLLDKLINIARESRNENIPFVNKSYGSEWDSVLSELMTLIETNQDLNGLTDRLTQCDIETINDQEFQDYEYAIPLFKNFTYKFIDLMLETSVDDEGFLNRTKVILEEIKTKYG